MCYNIAIYSQRKAIEKRFGIRFKAPERYAPHYHASAFSAPYLPVIGTDDPAIIESYRWGLVPHWVKDGKTANEIRFKTLNARSETIHEKRSFKDAVKTKRCLVLIEGFYEWREFKGNKYPYYIRLISKEPFALAGLWDRWEDQKEKREEYTFSVITTKANPLMAIIHNTRKRMPVILERENERKWLDELTATEIDSMLKPYNEGAMEAHPVSKLITARGINRNVPEVMVEYDYPELETLF